MTRTLRFSSNSALSEVGVVALLDPAGLERPKRGNRKGSRLGGDVRSVCDVLDEVEELVLEHTTGTCESWVKELNFSKVPLDTIGLLGAPTTGWLSKLL